MCRSAPRSVSVAVAFDRAGTLADRDQLILDYQPLARSLARRFANRGEPLDDLCQVALLGLVKAAGRFERSRGIEFSTFATVTITGELRRHFRDKRWGVHVPRSAQERYLVVRDTREHLTVELGRAPTVGEVATAAGIEPEDVIDAQETAEALRVGSLDAPMAHDGERMREVGGIDPGLAEVETRLTVESLIAQLPERDRELLRLRFVERLTQS